MSIVFTIDDGIIRPVASKVHKDDTLSSIVFDPQSVFKIISRLNANSAAGPDGIKPVFLKNVAEAIKRPLAFLFECLFLNGWVPHDWRKAHITPIYKKGDATLVSNYRPISLTSVCCKVVETIIKNEILSFLLTRKLISKQQHGFSSRHSTTTQLLECVHDCSIALDDKNSVDISYVDFSRAFDSVVHSKLICKLSSYGISDDLLVWLETFLLGRSQCVVINNFVSLPSDVLSGVPQGSVICPLLFLLYVNDVVEIFDDRVTCKLFADDLKMYTVLSKSIHTSPLSEALERLIHWSRTWQLGINIDKCSIVHLGRQPSLFSYKMGIAPLLKRWITLETWG